MIRCTDTFALMHKQSACHAQCINENIIKFPGISALCFASPTILKRKMSRHYQMVRKEVRSENNGSHYNVCIIYYYDRLFILATC